MSDEDSLQDALDGLISAVEYAESIGERELAREISSLYQEVGRVSPDEHWNEVYYCRVSGTNLQRVLEQNESTMLRENVSEGVFELYTTADGIEDLRSSSEVSEVEMLNSSHE